MSSITKGFLVVLLFVCLTIHVTNNKAEEENILDHQQVMINAAEMIAKDKANDEKSLVWDGSAMREVEDPLDNDQIMDGRAGPYAYTRLLTKMLMVYSVDSVSLLNAESIMRDDEDTFIAENETRYLRIRAVAEDYQKLVSSSKSLTDKGLYQPVKINCRCDVTGYAGLIQTEKGQLMVGITACLLQKNGMVYECQYAGIGNYSDIVVEAKMMIHRTFR